MYHCSMTIQEAYDQLFTGLLTIYDNSEAANITNWVMEYVTGKRKIDRITHPASVLSEQQQASLSFITRQLQAGIPVQYVLNECWFAGMKFYVDAHVLIPRPETEELVEWMGEKLKTAKKPHTTVLDIGTGSGCIAIALKKKHPAISIKSIDVSEGALQVAVKNAMVLGAQVYFMRIDFLDEHQWDNLGSFDLIVSNPPYIKDSEAAAMHKNVLEHEPHIALFVPDEDALLFYRKIAAFGKKHLSENGSVFLEINEALAGEVVQLLESHGYVTELKKDMQGKDRMIKATRS